MKYLSSSDIIKRKIIFTSIFLGLLMVFSYFLLNMAKGFSLSSLSFERQEISDKKSNYWLFWPSNKTLDINSSDGQPLQLPISNNINECGSDRISSSTIQSVSYQSDGNRLHDTIWLSSKLLNDILSKNDINSTNFNSSNPDLPLWHQLKFTMAVDLFSVFNQGVDYRVTCMKIILIPINLNGIKMYMRYQQMVQVKNYPALYTKSFLSKVKIILIFQLI